MATPETRSQLLAAVAACDDKKGEDTRILELDPADSGLADFFLITSATNDRQAVAIADEIEYRLKRNFGLYATSVEGRRQAEWILLDYVDIVIHVFVAEKRAFYDIERLRKSARQLTGTEVEAELKSALAEKTIAVRKSSPVANAAPGRVSRKSTEVVSKKGFKAKKDPQKGSTVTTKPTKKATKKAVAKPINSVASKATAKGAAKPAKKAAKSAVKKAASPAPSAMGALEPEARSSTGGFGDTAATETLSAIAPEARSSTGGFGSRRPIAKSVEAEEPGPLSLAASAASKVAGKASALAAKKAVVKKSAKMVTK